ncbi:probable serine/threonine-protein kinase At1g54610 isoform X2 [Phragmites australis]|uniref:probable serine/threonine-protein kinase At1g54610 isoform X2 n=1 Tax=Phragmites australis TaxID=29695 RepID=UPI002D793DDD|nr:probable serine/threonine-protein kinase At1g54610 isoform X2 [Phragmites australis]
MSPSPSRSLLHLHLLFGRRRSRRGNGSSTTRSGGMGCAQGKPRGSPARSDGRGIDRLMRDYAYRPAPPGTSRLSDPLPAAERAPPAKEPAHARHPAGLRDTEKTPDDVATTVTAQAPNPALPPPPPPPRREDELVDGWPTWLLDNVPREALHGIVPKSADAYDKIEKVGQGTYSNVYKARERGTGRIVALKKVRFDTSESESVRFMAREMRILQGLDHPNVIRLEGIATSRMHRSIYLVFDFMYSDLARLVARPGQRLTEPQIKCYMQQLLSGLQHCHERGILHRDIKGSNLLIDRDGVLKIGDFGLANYYGPSHRRPLTSRVVTLWYRAPELLLGSTDYGAGIDLWSAGCLLAEMFSGKPLMPGRTEVEQLLKIFGLCGSPPDDYWRKMKFSARFKPPKAYKPTMADRFRDLPLSALGLLTTLLALDPAARGTAAQALQSNFFSTPPLPCDLSSLPVVYKEEVADPAASHDGRKPKLRQRSQKRKDSRQKAEEQPSDEPKMINSGSPDNEERVTDSAKSGQESDGTVITAGANASSSSVQEPSNNTIVNASSSTVSKRFSVSPVQVLPPQGASPAAPQDQQLRRANSHHHSVSDDDHDNRQPLLTPDDDQADGELPGSGGGGVIVNHSLESRPAASMSDFDAAAAALRGTGELPSKQYVLVDHV